MREALFLKQNKERWKSYETQQTHDPDALAERFVQLTDDLAYARTFYPKSKTVQYLNGLAARFHLAIYKNKKEKENKFLQFWTTDLPYVMAKHYRQLLYAFLFFMSFVAIGALSAKYDESFLRLILGDGYVNMTNENIENGNPFGVYKGDNPFTMFIGIAINNIMVACRMFAKGIFLGLGTVQELISTGMMVGSFEYSFFAKGLGWGSIMVVMLHGTLELSAIVIAGAAGLVVAKGIIFPKTQQRIQSVMEAARDGIKIILGLFPFFILAAFIEGMLTRTMADTFTTTGNYKETVGMPVPVGLAILVGSMALVLWYFVIYPQIIYRRVNRQGAAPEESFE
jgi:uncharacterized membrane protein SpoIIM required for sporulation